MKWKKVGKNRTGDVIDVRGAKPSRSGSGGGTGGLGGIQLPSGGGLGKLGGGAGVLVLIAIVAFSLLSGGGAGGFDLGQILGAGAAPPSADDPQPLDPSEDPDADLKDFSTYVFVDAQDTWREAFAAGGDPYDNAQLVLYSDAVNTGGCGSASSAVGPFYCPADSRVYLDLTFYEDMERQLGASGDFAWAYVIAHEMGHHIQNLTGTNEKVRQLQAEDSGDANELSVRMELQADCYAGVWASTVFAEGDLEAGDIEEAFGAAESVGDDRIQKKATGEVNPDSFTHGTSDQRRAWFTTGYESGDPAVCDTFTPDEV